MCVCGEEGYERRDGKTILDHGIYFFVYLLYINLVDYE